MRGVLFKSMGSDRKKAEGPLIFLFTASKKIYIRFRRSISPIVKLTIVVTAKLREPKITAGHAAAGFFNSGTTVSIGFKSCGPKAIKKAKRTEINSTPAMINKVSSKLASRILYSVSAAHPN